MGNKDYPSPIDEAPWDDWRKEWSFIGKKAYAEKPSKNLSLVVLYTLSRKRYTSLSLFSGIPAKFLKPGAKSDVREISKFCAAAENLFQRDREAVILYSIPQNRHNEPTPREACLVVPFARETRSPVIFPKISMRSVLIDPSLCPACRPENAPHAQGATVPSSRFARSDVPENPVRLIFDDDDDDEADFDDDFDDDFDEDFDELPDSEFDEFEEFGDEIDEPEFAGEAFDDDLDETLDPDGFEDFDDLEADENTFDDEGDSPDSPEPPKE